MAKLRKIAITDSELRKLKFQGKGTYGSVFADLENGNVIKIYHKYQDGGIKNPCLNVNVIKYMRLNKRACNIQFTDTDLQLVYDNRRFVGVSKKYYDEALPLNKINGLSLSMKKDILTQLIRNVEELTKNKIYCLDCKANNALLTKEGEVKIIDLDDVLTKTTLFPNILYKKKCLHKLKETIIDVIYYNQSRYSSDVSKRVISNSKKEQMLRSNLSYQKLYEFVDSIDFHKNVLVVKVQNLKDINIQELKGFLDENELSLVLSFDKDVIYKTELLHRTLDYLEKVNIKVYDIFGYEDFDKGCSNYISAHDCECAYLDEDVKKLKKYK